MMTEIPEDIYDYIIKDLAEGLDPHEKEALQAWLKASHDNHRAWLEVCTLWYNGSIGSGKASGQDQQAWAAIRSKAKRTKTHTLYYRLSGMAASLLLICAAYFAIRSYKGNNDNGPIMLPTTQPTLVLETGKEVNLEDLQDIRMLGIDLDTASAKLSYNSYAQKHETVYHQLIIPKGGDYQLELADGTLVMLNSESSLRFPTQMEGATREVWVTGEAYFDVSHDKSRPFIVHAGNVSTKVLGTKFDVNAYEIENTIHITLVEGLVEVQDDSLTTKLYPGHTLSVETPTGAMTMLDVDTDLVTGWIHGILYFDNITLGQLMVYLQRWYNISVEFQSEELMNRHFTGGIQKSDNADKIFAMIEKVNDVAFSINNRHVTISKK